MQGALWYKNQVKTLADIAHLIPGKWLTFDNYARYGARGFGACIRFIWFREFGNECQYCGVKMCHPSNKPFKPNNKWMATIEHITPRAKGGTDELHNLTLVCQRCNLREAKKTYYEIKAA